MKSEKIILSLVNKSLNLFPIAHKHWLPRSAKKAFQLLEESYGTTSWKWKLFFSSLELFPFLFFSSFSLDSFSRLFTPSRASSIRFLRHHHHSNSRVYRINQIFLRVKENFRRKMEREKLAIWNSHYDLGRC